MIYNQSKFLPPLTDFLEERSCEIAYKTMEKDFYSKIRKRRMKKCHSREETTEKETVKEKPSESVHDCC